MHRMTCPRCCSNDSLIKLIDVIQAHCKLIHIKEKGAGITAFVQTLRRALLACFACTKQAYLWLLCGDDGDGSSSTGALTKSSFNTCTTPQSRTARKEFAFDETAWNTSSRPVLPPTALRDDGTTWTWSPDDTKIWTEVSGKEIQKVLIKAILELYLWRKKFGRPFLNVNKSSRDGDLSSLTIILCTITFVPLSLILAKTEHT